MGLNNMVRVIEFKDRVRWVARLRMPSINGVRYSPSTATTMENERNAMLLVQKMTKIVVPTVHAMETNEECDVGAPFMLMECLDGNVGMDLGMEVPQEHKVSFYKMLAQIQVALSTVQLPQIGTILSINDDGIVRQGPIPGIGGPFDTATAFFRAWSTTAQFGMSEERLRAASGQFASEVLPGVAAFPRDIEELASRLSICDQGPFPLFHGDFGHNNVVVNDQYEVLGVIDWEGAFAAPWEIAGSLPLTLSTTPQAMDVPWNYDAEGNPRNSMLVEKLADQKTYRRAVEEEGKRLAVAVEPSVLNALLDRERQDLVTAMRLYTNGKAGFYSKVVEQFRSRES